MVITMGGMRSLRLILLGTAAITFTAADLIVLSVERLFPPANDNDTEQSRRCLEVQAICHADCVATEVGLMSNNGSFSTIAPCPHVPRRPRMPGSGRRPDQWLAMPAAVAMGGV